MKIIVIGGGKTVYFLAKGLISHGHDVTIVNRDPEESQALSHQLSATIIAGDGSDPETLEQAGAARASVFIALTPQDHDNLVACQIAQEKFDVPRTIALVNNPDNEDVFRRLGVSLIFSATRILASLLEEQAGFMAITNLMAIAQGKLNVTEVLLNDNAPVTGKSLEELQLPEGFLLAIIVRNDEVLVPGGSTVLQGQDRLLLIGQADNFGEVLGILTGE